MAKKKNPLPQECVPPAFTHKWVAEGPVHKTIMGRIQIFRCKNCKALGSGAPQR